MSAVDYILDGLAAELELERELGVRAIEIDRSLLVATAVESRREPPKAVEPRAAEGRRQPSAAAESTAFGRYRQLSSRNRQSDSRTIEQSNSRTILDFVFLHHQPLSPKGVEMMAKIITAMGKTAETAPVVVVPPPPKAKVYVVLGGLALKLYFPGLRGAPGQWLQAEGGEGVLVTYSPEYILRFGTVTPAVKKMKQDMWTSLKAVVQRTR